MNYNELDIALKDFGRYVVEQSKANLKKDKKGDGDLYNSISYKFRQETNAFLLEFLIRNKCFLIRVFNGGLWYVSRPRC